ncbi:MAG: glycosyltransferase family 2 protein [Clostridia bacterium]|nr:glycosyltransferase family 2 protein [Clostridia bacterium]
MAKENNVHTASGSPENLPLVSVVMPCYNDGATLPESIASVRAQTYPRVELIVVDDGSDDPETVRVLDGLRGEDLTLLRNDHKGPSVARNTAIRAARGTYILPVDSDDLIDPVYIQRAVEKMEEDPSLGIVYCHAVCFGEKTGPWDIPDYSMKHILLDNCIFVTALFRREDWEKAGGFCEDFRAGMEDYDFWLSILGMGREVYQFEEAWFHYRVKPKSRTTSFQDLNQYGALQETYERIYYRHRDFFREHMDEYCTQLRWHLNDQLAQNKVGPKAYYVHRLRDRHPKLAAILEKLIKP